jgi:UDP-N-acetylmuramoylalanine--D-glutamate ligase
MRPDTANRSVVVGLGRTGVSCVRHLARRGLAVSVTDTRSAPPGLAELGALAGEVELRLGGFDLSLLEGASQVLLSPGVSADEPIAREARARGIDVLGDIELFARAAGAPVVAITGTNGKSTVTSLVACMASAAGWRVLAGGNLGEPALDLLEQPAPDLYVLELSSFQLETTRSLRLAAAAVLNVSADHLDRYASVGEYARAKSRIFLHAAAAVVNADDARVMAMLGPAPGTSTGTSTGSSTGSETPRRVLTFRISPGEADFSLLTDGEAVHLARRGTRLLDTARMKISGRHNAANALAALAVGEAAGLPMPAMLQALEEFPGLAHRTQWVADVAGVRYVDDSKGTNVGATLAAVAGLAGPLVLIAGGEGKGQDFGPLGAAVRGKVRHCVLIGKDAALLGAALAGACSTQRVETLAAAVDAAHAAARPGDTVLLSPACASLDMFRDYRHRGAEFAALARALAARYP